MKQQKSKAKFKDWPEIIVGVALFLVGIILWIVKVNGMAVGSYLGIGSFIIGGASSFGSVRNYIEQQRNIGMLDGAISKWHSEATKSSLNIRKSQRITFHMTRYSFKGESYLLLKCTHEYTYEYGSYTGEYVIIDTFNDMSIPLSLNKHLPSDKKTQFVEVAISKSDEEKVVYHCNDIRHNSKFLLPGDKENEYKRPGFKLYESSGIKLSPSQKVDLRFEINNTHMMRSEHSWYFEQISEGLTLIIHNETGLPANGFTLIFNHPEREKIEADNDTFINNSGILKSDFVEIKIPFVILPYQGFVLSWDFLTDNETNEVEDDNP
jgi:hypothetical protein